MFLIISLIIGAFAMSVTHAPPVDSVTLTLQTRGVHKSILITAQQTNVDVNGTIRHYPTSVTQWQAIQKALDQVDLSGLSSLPVNVSKSAVDAALSAHIQVVSRAQTYESAYYDHPDPPTKLVPLVQAMLACIPAAAQADFR